MIRFFAAATLLAAPAIGAELRVPVGNFDRIALGGSPDVTVTTGRTASVVATGDQRALDRLDIRVDRGTLKIGPKRGNNWNWRDYGKVRVAVGVPMVRGVELGGSGTVSVDRVKTPDFAAEIGGSGSIRVAALDTGKASFSIGGSGNVDVAGRCDSASIDIAGSGSARLGGLRCRTLSASVAGSGNIDANASATASVTVAGSGDVRVGGGAKCAVSKHGSGSVNCGTV